METRFTFKGFGWVVWLHDGDICFRRDNSQFGRYLVATAVKQQNIEDAFKVALLKASLSVALQCQQKREAFAWDRR